eukprot:6209779-Pleurochrysis_carterae.AAC.6
MNEIVSKVIRKFVAVSNERTATCCMRTKASSTDTLNANCLAKGAGSKGATGAWGMQGRLGRHCPKLDGVAPPPFMRSLNCCIADIRFCANLTPFW